MTLRGWSHVKLNAPIVVKLRTSSSSVAQIAKISDRDIHSAADFLGSRGGDGHECRVGDISSCTVNARHMRIHAFLGAQMPVCFGLSDSGLTIVHRCGTLGHSLSNLILYAMRGHRFACPCVEQGASVNQEECAAAQGLDPWFFVVTVPQKRGAVQ
jgi:hypothetical protein